MTFLFETHAKKDTEYFFFFVRDETGGYTSFLNFRNNRQQGYREVIFGEIAILSFLKIVETFAFFQFVNWAPSLELTFITAVMEGAKASAHSLRTNVGRLSGPRALGPVYMEKSCLG